MELHDVCFKYKGYETINIFPIGDMHIGNKNFDEKLFLKTIEYIKQTPNSYILGMGDYADFVSVDDKRYFSDSFDRNLMDPDDQVQKVISYFEPVKDKIIGLLEGNHEFKLDKMHHYRVVKNICKQLGVAYLGHDAFIDLHFQRGQDNTRKNIKLLLYATHGSGGGSSKGMKVTKIERLSEWIDADIFLMGHFHVLSSTNAVIMTKRGKKLVEQDKVYGLTGSFLSGYKLGNTSYVDRAMMKPHKLGCLVLKITPEKRKIDMEYYTG